MKETGPPTSSMSAWSRIVLLWSMRWVYNSSREFVEFGRNCPVCIYSFNPSGKPFQAWKSYKLRHLSHCFNLEGSLSLNSSGFRPEWKNTARGGNFLSLSMHGFLPNDTSSTTSLQLWVFGTKSIQSNLNSQPCIDELMQTLGLSVAVDEICCFLIMNGTSFRFFLSVHLLFVSSRM